ncbi:META domain-containing protein [Marinomonas ostreistagni]|uniref:META domain-containing protein n=1 Tax=Marinomonas ostreistagni TaxID=359209 RepID=UPI00194F2A74|nr:META domain-containing protein [Marinomonas ostreistagni]MBM6551846.1 META domain-containing protein [Marinomonas ostreistagni]
MNKNWTLVAVLAALTGCAQQPTASQATESVSLSELSGQWRVESIDEGGIIDSSHITMNFSGDQRVAGMAGCNRYSATMTEQGDTIMIEQAISTKMACTPALMKQEQRFLDALHETVAFERLANTWLIAEDRQGKPRLKMIEMVSASAAATSQSNQTNMRQFRCGTAGEVGIRPVSEGVVELSVADQMLILSTVPSASGAKYGEGEVSFWEHGNEAMFESAGRRFECQRAG